MFQLLQCIPEQYQLLGHAVFSVCTNVCFNSLLVLTSFNCFHAIYRLYSSLIPYTLCREFPTFCLPNVFLKDHPPYVLPSISPRPLVYHSDERSFIIKRRGWWKIRPFSPFYHQSYRVYCCSRTAQPTFFCFPWWRPCDYHAICCMDGKTIQCLPNPRSM